jgi:hypothetical protein
MVMLWSWRVSTQRAWMAQRHHMPYIKRHVSSTTNQDIKKRELEYLSAYIFFAIGTLTMPLLWRIIIISVRNISICSL